LQEQLRGRTVRMAAALPECVRAALELVEATDALPGVELPEDATGESGGAARRFDVSTWDDFCGKVQERRVQATCVIDFAYSDNGSLKGDDRSAPVPSPTCAGAWRAVLLLREGCWRERGVGADARGRRVRQAA